MDDPARRDALKMAVAAAGALSLGGLGGAPALARPAPGGDRVDQDDGAAWLEESWSVEAAALPRFLAAYDANFHRLARQTPGYLGAAVLTASDRPHSRAADDWDALFGRAYNVLIVHRIRTWADADAFQAQVTALHDAARAGAGLPDQMARTVFPLARGYRDAEMRTVATVLRRTANGGRPMSTADHWRVPAERFGAWLRDYDARVQDLVGHDPRYGGYRVATSLPRQDWEGPAPCTGEADGRRLGAGEALYIKSPGLVGACSGVSIDVGALYNNSHNVVVLHEIRGGEDAAQWLGRFATIYADEHNNAAFTKAWSSPLLNIA